MAIPSRFLSHLSLPATEGDRAGPHILTHPEDAAVYPVADASGIYPISAARTPPEPDLLAHYLLDIERDRLATEASTTPDDMAVYYPINACMWLHLSPRVSVWVGAPLET